MAHWMFRVLVTGTLMVAGSASVVPAHAGPEKTIHFRGHSTVAGCQADVRVTFDVIAGSHGLKRVENFRATNLNYPNQTSSTTSIPVGEPGSLGCYPGGNLSVHVFESYQTYSSVIPFGGEGTVNDASFSADNRFEAYGTLLEEDQVFGAVRAHTKKGRTIWRVTGDLVYATSEGGLNWGISTGHVPWKASARTRNVGYTP